MKQRCIQVDYIFAEGNGREITGRDKIFGISRAGRKRPRTEYGRENIVNATIGALLDDDGKLIALFLHGGRAEKYDAPGICGIRAYRRYAGISRCHKGRGFGDYIPQGSIEACATPGGTGSIRNVISNYSRPGDKILTSNWHWSPYQVIASEIGRSVETYQMFDEKNDFNLASFREHIQSVLTEQDSIVILFNAPAHNPTGYTPSDETWDEIIRVLKECAVSGKKNHIFPGHRLYRFRRRFR